MCSNFQIYSEKAEEDGNGHPKSTAPMAATLCVGRVRRGSESRSDSPTWWRLRTPVLLGHRLQTSMTRATVDDSTAGLAKPSVRYVLRLVGYPSMASWGCA